LPSHAGCRDFAAGVNHAAVADRSQKKGKREIAAEYAGAEIAFGYRYGLTRPKDDFLEGAAIFAQRDFVFRASIQVIENNAR
jgi:hypothetical protein